MNEEKIIEVLEERGWSVCDCSAPPTLCWDISWCSPAGEDFIITVSGACIDELVEDLISACECFDVEEHVYNWLMAKRSGTRGVPCIEDLLEDAIAIQDELTDLAATVRAQRRKSRREVS